MSSAERKLCRLGDVTVSQDSRRRPVKSTERNPGPYPYYGASGIVDYVDSYLFEGLHLLIAEDGENLRSRTTPVAFLADGQFWVNNHAHVLQGNAFSDTRYLAYALEQLDLSRYLTGSTQPKLTKGALESVMLALPPLPEQQAIAEVLGALDDKIAANTALVATADALLATEFRTRLHQTEVHDRELTAIANVVLGGTPPRARPDYWTDGTIPWLNSGAVNATRIVEPSELISAEALANSAAKLMPNGATLLAITGATLGQIARLEMSASGNQSIVGVWSDDVHLNTWLYFAIQERLDDLLARATGAAQQHVSKGDVEQLAVPVPSQAVLEEFSTTAIPLLEIAAIAERENRTLAATRDALLPHLMSGKLRVRDAERVASEVGA